MSVLPLPSKSPVPAPGTVTIILGSNVNLGTTPIVVQPGVTLDIVGNGFALGGAGGLSISGGGTVVASGAATYTGGTTLSGVTLELTAGATAGTGAINFGSQPATLQIDAPVTGTQTFPNTLTGLIPGDKIDVQGLTFVAGSPAFPIPPTSNQLTVQGAGGATETFSLDPVTIGFTASDDGHGGTLLTATVDPGPSVIDTTTTNETVAHDKRVEIGTAAPGLPGDALTLTELTGPAGAVTLSDGIVSFEAPSGTVAFSYQVSDQYGDLSRIIFDTLTVDPGPSLTGTTTAGEKVAHGTTVAVGTVTPGLPGDTLTLTELTGPVGALTLRNGVVSFAAPANASGTAAFSYRISDQLGDVSQRHLRRAHGRSWPQGHRHDYAREEDRAWHHRRGRHRNARLAGRHADTDRADRSGRRGDTSQAAS